MLCYLGNSTEQPKIYNPIAPRLYVQDVVTAIFKDASYDPAPATHAIEAVLKARGTMYQGALLPKTVLAFFRFQ